jgi:hypothetical protein
VQAILDVVEQHSRLQREGGGVSGVCAVLEKACNALFTEHEAVSAEVHRAKGGHDGRGGGEESGEHHGLYRGGRTAVSEAAPAGSARLDNSHQPGGRQPAPPARAKSTRDVNRPSPRNATHGVGSPRPTR